MTNKSAYDKAPFVAVSEDATECTMGWHDIVGRLSGAVRPDRFLLCVECYPGADVSEIARALEQRMSPGLLLISDDCFCTVDELDRMLAPDLTDDPVFGRMSGRTIPELLDPEKLADYHRRVAAAGRGLIVVVGTGASVVLEEWDLLVYADMARWVIQQRQRRNEIGNLGVQNRCEPAAAKYKRAYFVDWRAGDRLKQQLIERIDYLLDTNDRTLPRMISGEAFRRGLAATVRRPFRVVPFFDPGPWGGQWMKSKFDLPHNAPNYAWCFDCVPEENSLLLGFGSRRVEIPAMDVVLRHPRDLLGDRVCSRFGAEFPIRFDLLDTMGGGNLSLQVHPLPSYIREQFGMAYTQDESYYILDAAPDAVVYLGVRDGGDRARMESDLLMAQKGTSSFPADEYVSTWPARTHDHFLIPAGTIHCSGRNSVVLEISATPYIFTFKLWDWGRMGLDGEPRPIHVGHGLRNIMWDRSESWVKRNLINRIQPVSSGPGWTEERTGLHELEFIETRRHWFSGPVCHDTRGTVNVLNLIAGEAAVIESPSRAFEPFVVNSAETFVVPAQIGRYIVRPLRTAESPLATIKAFVRSDS